MHTHLTRTKPFNGTGVLLLCIALHWLTVTCMRPCMANLLCWLECRRGYYSTLTHCSNLFGILTNEEPLASTNNYVMLNWDTWYKLDMDNWLCPQPSSHHTEKSSLKPNHTTECVDGSCQWLDMSELLKAPAEREFWLSSFYQIVHSI